MVSILAVLMPRAVSWACIFVHKPGRSAERAGAGVGSERTKKSAHSVHRFTRLSMCGR